MDKFSVHQLAKMANISARTLHHYDEIGLLKPAFRADSGYRYYTKEELLRLQQILFYKELDLPLAEIQQILDEPEFDRLQALDHHKEQMRKKVQRYETLIRTIDKTILDLKNKQRMTTYEEMYEGFSKEQVDEYEKEVTERWGGERLEESKRNIQAMTKQEWGDLKAEGENINRSLAAIMDHSPTDADVQRLVARHHIMIGKFYECPYEVYRGLGNMYVADERFTATYDKYKPGLAVFLQKAIEHYCNERENK
ncbi:MAG: MerR family transcriptional regulator [Sphingobacteriales bacterium]|nr:MAG: MerR family transcriptional regulator [Sphingobacteriales bacterium]